MKLSYLLHGIQSLDDPIIQNMEIVGLTADSRHVESGFLFTAIQGYESDGHDFIDDAIERGAVAVIAEHDMDIRSVPVILGKNSRQALSLMAGRYFSDPGLELDLICVTGTNGKTTVSILLESILQSAGISTGLMGTMIYRWPGHETDASRTTPDIIEMHGMLRDMVDAGVESVVMEVSSHALDLHRVEGLRFKAAVFTNLSRDHLDFHRSLEAYGASKARLFSMLTTDGRGVLNGDDPAHETMMPCCSDRKITFGIHEDNDYRIVDIDQDKRSTSFVIAHEKGRISLSTPLWGNFNVMNATAAAVTALEMNVDEQAVRDGILRVESVRGRMEGFQAKDGVRIVVDYAHTPDALENVLRTVRAFTPARIIVVFGCGGDRDRGKRPEMGKVGYELSDLTYVTSDNPRREDPGRIIEDILAGIIEKDKVRIVEDRKKAICSAVKEARDGDTVVIAGKGHETYQEIGTERIPFDDRSVAEACLKGKRS